MLLCGLREKKMSNSGKYVTEHPRCIAPLRPYHSPQREERWKPTRRACLGASALPSAGAPSHKAVTPARAPLWAACPPWDPGPGGSPSTLCRLLFGNPQSHVSGRRESTPDVRPLCARVGAQPFLYNNAIGCFSYHKSNTFVVGNTNKHKEEKTALMP